MKAKEMNLKNEQHPDFDEIEIEKHYDERDFEPNFYDANPEYCDEFLQKSDFSWKVNVIMKSFKNEDIDESFFKNEDNYESFFEIEDNDESFFEIEDKDLSKIEPKPAPEPKYEPKQLESGNIKERVEFIWKEKGYKDFVIHYTKEDIIKMIVKTIPTNFNCDRFDSMFEGYANVIKKITGQYRGNSQTDFIQEIYAPFFTYNDFLIYKNDEYKTGNEDDVLHLFHLNRLENQIIEYYDILKMIDPTFEDEYIKYQQTVKKFYPTVETAFERI